VEASKQPIAASRVGNGEDYRQLRPTGLLSPA
jgi:hypothetical protein